MRNPALSRVVRGLSSRTSTSAIIAGLVLVAPITHAISAGFTGTGSPSSGVSISSNRDQITFNSSIAGSNQGLITWTPTDNATNPGAPIDFLPNGNSVIFQTDGSSSPYTILNRVVPADMSRPIALNGLITSYAGTMSSGNVGGSIWFYSPGGVLVGSTAVLNVGSLLLTSSDPALTGNTFIDGNGHFSLGQAANGSKVSIAAGAQINALSAGSYVALIAPSVTQSGTVTVNGSAAYVAADAADMTINQGLFDITVTTGTSASGTVLTHDGSTTGPAAVTGQETHRVYLVAVPKNDAITMLISGGGALGFDMAGAADVQGNAIILSAGKSIAGGLVDTASNPTAPNADISIAGGDFTSAVTGVATHDAVVSNVVSGSSIHFRSDLNLSAPHLASVTSGTAQQSILIDNNLVLDAGVGATTSGGPVTAGTAQLFASNGGTLTVIGSADLYADATGNGGDVNMGVPVGANGGLAQIRSTGGAIDIGGTTSLSAGAFPGYSDFAPASALALVGGHTNVQANGAGASVHLGGSLYAQASASAGESSDITGNTFAGVSAQGGNVLLENSGGGTLTIDGFASLSADGSGQSVYYGPVGGAGTGGQVNVNAFDGAMVLTGGLQAEAYGQGGNAYSNLANGGLGTGGQIVAGAANAAGSLTIGQFDSSTTLDLVASGSGGSSYALGGNGMGGNVQLVANGGTTHVFAPSYSYSLRAQGFGGQGVTGGNGTNGFAAVRAMDGIVTMDGPVQLHVNATGGTAQNNEIDTPHRGNAQGGTAEISTTGTGQITINGDVTAYAGADVAGDSATAGGSTTGGAFNLFANGTGSIHVTSSVSAYADAAGGDNGYTGGVAGTGTGGGVFVEARDTTSVMIDGQLFGSAIGTGGRSVNSGTGAAGTGGMLSAGGGSGQLTIDSVDFSANGTGGNGYMTGGIGTGGSALVRTSAAGGVVTINTGVDLTASGRGGTADPLNLAPAGTITTGGAGFGGNASVDAENGSIFIGGANASDAHIVLDATGIGGDGFNGGAGTGGGFSSGTGATIYARGGSVTFTAGSSGRSSPIEIYSDGFGGSGRLRVSDGIAGQGGLGQGGFAGIEGDNNAANVASTISLAGVPAYVEAIGEGGDGGSADSSHVGGAGGAGIGGNATLIAQAGNGNITVGQLTLDSSGYGGFGGDGDTGGIGGAGTGGGSQAGVFSGGPTPTATAGTAYIGDYIAFASGIGGDGGFGNSLGGAGGSGQGGLANIASRGGITMATSATFTVNGEGGYGGTSNNETVQTEGVGGNGQGGKIGVLSTPRFETSVVGSLTVTGDISGTVAGVAGTGSQSGSAFGGHFQIQAIGGSIAANNITLDSIGAPLPTGAIASEISAVGTGTINIANALSVASEGDIGLYFDQGGTLNTASALISARSVTPFGELDTAAPTGTGIFHADSLIFNVAQDFRTTTSFDTPGDFTLFVPGATQVGNVNAGLGITINFDAAMSATHGTGLTTGNLTSGRSVLLQTDGNAVIGSVTASDSIVSVSGGTTSIGNLSAGRVNPTASTGLGYIANVFATGGSTIGDVTAKGEVRFGTLNGSIAAGNITTDRYLIALAKQNVSLGSVTTGLAPTLGGPTNNQTTEPSGVYIGHSGEGNSPASQLFQFEPTAIEGALSITGPVTTATFQSAAAGNVTTGAITSREIIRSTGGGNGSYGALVAGNRIEIGAGGSVTIASASAGRVNPSSDSNADYQIGVKGGTGVTIGDTTAKGSIGMLAAAGNVTAGNVVTDQSLVVLSANNISVGGISTATTGTGTGVYLADASMYSIVADDLIPSLLFAVAPVAVGGSIQIGGPVTTSQFVASAHGAFAASTIDATDRININFDNTMGATHGTSLTTGNLTTGRSALLQTDGNASIGSVTARDSIITVSGGTTSIGNLSAGRGDPLAATPQGYVAQVFAGGGSTIGDVTAKGEVRFQSLNGSISAGNIVTDRHLVVLAGQNVSLGSITTALIPTAGGPTNNQTVSPGGVYISRAVGTFVPAGQLFPNDPTRIGGSITINGPVTTGTFKAAASGAFSAPSIASNDFVFIDAGGATAINSLVSRYDTEIDGDGSATIGTMDTGGEGHVEVAGQVTVNSATAGRMTFSGTAPSGTFTSGNNASDSGPSVVLIGGTGVSLGTASASGDIGLVSNGNVVVTGSLTSDASVGALVGGDLTLGSVTTGTGANGLYIGNSSLYPQVQDSDGNAAEILFSQAPPRTGGSVSLGAVSAGRVRAASGGAFTASAITAATDINIDSGGLATFNGVVSAPTISIGSLDIAVGSMASIGNASTTNLTLTSGGTETTIGGTTTGASAGQVSLATTYTLDGAEAARLRGQQINVVASGDVTMGSLNLSGSGNATGNLVGSNARFQVQTPGSIRVTGSVNLANAASTDTLGFVAGNRFEIATDTGQLQLLGADGKVGGIAAITAANAAVGTSSLLTQLRADPKFAGRDSLLASAPLTGSKLDGYLQAGKMNFTIGNTLLIQNSGVGSTLAGFTVGAGGITVANSGTSPIDVVLYGQAFDSSGAAVPIASIGGVVKATQTSSTSNVDGCLFATGVCSPVNTGASVQVVAQTQLASITSSIQSAVSGNVGSPQGSTSPAGGAASGDSGSGGSSGGGGDDDSEGDSDAGSGGGKTATANPNVLIDTSSIGQTANTQIDTPVTSSGNTSLWSGEDGLAGATGTNP